MSSVSSHHGYDHVDEDRRERLVGWNTEQLEKILKQVVARRAAQTAALELKVGFHEESEIVGEGKSLLDDVKEIIELPEYDQDVTSRQVNPDTIEIPRDVVGEIQAYVDAVSNLYHNNHFHNFEHASAGTYSSCSFSEVVLHIASP